MNTMTQKELRFTARLGTIGDMDLDSKSDEELKELLEDECNIPTDSIELVEVV